jgi:predicted transcriptional regulator
MCSQVHAVRMETVTIRLPQALKEELEAEADAADRTLSAHIRHELEQRESRKSLKQRVEALEREVYERTRTNTERIPANTSDHEQRTPTNTDEYDVLAGVDVAGDGDLEEQRLDAARELLEWLRDRGSAQRADIVDDWLTEDIIEQVRYNSERSIWNKWAQRVLKSADHVALEGRTWRWVA